MTDESIRAGDGQGWTMETIQASNLRTLLDGRRINTDQTPVPRVVSQRVYSYIYMRHLVKLRMIWAMYWSDAIQELGVIRHKIS